MRLRAYEIKAIKESVGKLDEHAKVYLFGSRVDDAKKGGDIDLLIFSQILTQEHAFKISGRICDKIGEQKIDIVIEKDTSNPFTRVIMKEAILL